MKLDDHDRAWADRLLAMTHEQLRTNGGEMDFTGRGRLIAYVLKKAREDAVQQAFKIRAARAAKGGPSV